MASKSTKSPPDISAVATELLDGCRAGDRDAQRQLYELCHLRVYRLMVRMVGLQDAADLTQQVFMQVFRRINQFAGRSRFETWLYRLAVNESLQYLRGQNRRKFQPLTYEPTSYHQNEHDRHENKELLEEALVRVEPELRSLFLLREVDELSYREIAEAFDIPEGTVGSRLNQARRELQQHLIDLGWEP